MKFLAGTMLTLFVGLMFVSLIHMSGTMEMSHGMSPGMGACPFMTGHEVLCSMNINEHIGAWKTIFATGIPVTFTLLSVLGAAVLLARVAPYLLRTPILTRIPISWYQLSRDIHSHIVRPLQELFASGILHPKLF